LPANPTGHPLARQIPFDALLS